MDFKEHLTFVTVTVWYWTQLCFRQTFILYKLGKHAVVACSWSPRDWNKLDVMIQMWQKASGHCESQKDTKSKCFKTCITVAMLWYHDCVPLYLYRISGSHIDWHKGDKVWKSRMDFKWFLKIPIIKFSAACKVSSGTCGKTRETEYSTYSWASCAKSIQNQQKEEEKNLKIKQERGWCYVI